MKDSYEIIKELNASNKEIFIYTRKSQDYTKGVALEQQTNDCKDWLISRGFDLTKEKISYFEDIMTGTTDKRPDYQNMINSLHKAKLVLINDITRLSRKRLDVDLFYEECKKNDVYLVAVKNNLQSWDTATFSIILAVMSSLAENEVESISIRQCASKRFVKNSTRGASLGGRAPFGYTSKKINFTNSSGKTTQVPYYFNVKSEFDIVKLIYSFYFELRSISLVLNKLNEKAILWEDRYSANKEFKQFDRSKITEILTNPIYIIPSKKAYEYFKAKCCTLNNNKNEWDSKKGIVCYNRHHQAYQSKKAKDKKHSKNDMKEWILVLSSHHQGIISIDDYIEANEIRINNTTNLGLPHQTNQTSLLNGLVYCGCCDEKCYPKYTNTYKEYINGDRLFNYRCKSANSAKTKGGCKNRSLIPGNLLDKYVVEKLFELLDIEIGVCYEYNDKENLKRVENDFNKFISNKVETISIADTTKKQYEQQIKQLDKIIQKKKLLLNQLSSSNSLVINEYANELNEALLKKKEIENKLININDNINKEKQNTYSFKEFGNLYLKIRNNWETLDFNSKKYYINSMISKVVVNSIYECTIYFKDNNISKNESWYNCLTEPIIQYYENLKEWAKEEGKEYEKLLLEEKSKAVPYMKYRKWYTPYVAPQGVDFVKLYSTFQSFYTFKNVQPKKIIVQRNKRLPDQNNLDTLGKIIKFYRMVAYIKQVDLAKAMGVGVDVIKNLENKERTSFNVKLINEILIYLNIDKKLIRDGYIKFILNKPNEKITAIRTKNKLTKTSLALLLDIKLKTITMWENSKAIPSYQCYLKIKKLFK